MGFGLDLAKGAATGGVGTALGAVGSLIGGAIQYRQQKKLMKQQNQYNIDQFNRENARQDYLLANGAAIQKDALKNAGISAATLGGDFGNSTPSTNQSQGVDIPSAPMPDIGAGRNVAGEISQMKQAEASSDLAASQAEKNRAEAGLLRKQLGNYDITFAAEQDKRVADAVKAQADAQIARINQDIAERGKENRVTLLSLEVAEKTQSIVNMMSENAATLAKVDLTREQIATEQKRREEISANIRNLDSLVVKNMQEAATSKALSQIYKDEHDRKEAKDLLLDAQAAFESYRQADFYNMVETKKLEQVYDLNGKQYTLNGYMLERSLKAQELVNAIEEGDLMHAKTLYETLRPELESRKLDIEAVKATTDMLPWKKK